MNDQQFDLKRYDERNLKILYNPQIFHQIVVRDLF